MGPPPLSLRTSVLSLNPKPFYLFFGPLLGRGSIANAAALWTSRLRQGSALEVAVSESLGLSLSASGLCRQTLMQHFLRKGAISSSSPRRRHGLRFWWSRMPRSSRDDVESRRRANPSCKLGRRGPRSPHFEWSQAFCNRGELCLIGGPV